MSQNPIEGENALKLKIANSLDKIGVTALEWNQLTSQSETNTIFQTYEWFQSWWKVFGAKHQLHIVTIYENQELVGISPLMISGKYPGRVMRFIGDGKSDYCDFICQQQKKKAILSVLIKHIFSIAYQWDSIGFNNIPDSSSTVTILKEICPLYRSKVIFRVLNLCPTLVILGNEENTIKLINKTILKRRYYYFIKTGYLTFINIVDQKLAQQFLEVFFEQHIRRWNLRDTPSLFLDQDNRNFYRELTRSLLEKQWLLFSMLEYEGKPIAFHFGFDYNSKIIWYKPSFDCDYFKRSPGKVLLRFLIQYALLNNKAEFDFTIGDEPFKNEFANQKRMNLQVKIFNHKIQYFFDKFFYHLWLKVKRQYFYDS